MADEATMELRRQVEALRSQMEDLRIENRVLAQKAAGEATGFPEKRVPTIESPATPIFSIPLAAHPEPVAPDPKPVKKEVPPMAPPPAVRKEPEPGIWARLRAWAVGMAALVREQGPERIVGERLLSGAGIVLLVLGGAFFLKYTAGALGPWGRLALGFATAGALLGGGQRLRGRPGFAPLSLALIGGGWVLAYYTVFAAHYVPQSKVIASSRLELVLLMAAAAGMISHASALGSRVLTVFALSTAYFVFGVTHLGVETLTVCGLLAVSGAWLSRRLDSPGVAAANLAGFYIDSMPVLGSLIAAGTRAPVADLWTSLAITTCVQAVTVWLCGSSQRMRESKTADAALSLAGILYAAAACAQVSATQAPGAGIILLGVASVLGLGSSLAGPGAPGRALPEIQSLLAAIVAAVGALKLPSVPAQLWGLVLAASALSSSGLWSGRASLERYGIALSGLAAVWAWGHQGTIGEGRGLAALALAWSGAAAYGLAWARSHMRSAPGAETGAHLVAGLGMLLMSLWTGLEPPAFCVAAMGLGLILELAGPAGQGALLRQAVLVQTAAGIYSFFLDYGANAPVLGPLTPRGLVSLCLAASYLRLTTAAAAPQGTLLGWELAGWRRAQAWLLAAVAGCWIYAECGPRLRLPLWSLTSLVFLAAGRRRGDAGSSLRTASVAMTLATVVEGVISYYLQPAALGAVLSIGELAVYCGSALALLVPLVFTGWAQDDAEAREERRGHYLAAALSLKLLALLVAKEADGALITIAWGLIGVGYLTPGLWLDSKPLRLPGLALLILCVLKALFRDLTGLALPYRVLSFAVLGLLMVGSSWLYAGRREREARHAP